MIRYITILTAVAAIVAGTFVSLRLEDKREKFSLPGEDLTVKENADAFFVAVQRGVFSFSARPLDRLVEKDILGLFYSSERDGYLAVFSRDNSGEVALLYPAGGKTSAAISVGHETPLRDGAVVGAGHGCEWLVAVFSELPLKVVDLMRAIQKSERVDEHACELKVVVPDARVLRVLPVRR